MAKAAASSGGASGSSSSSSSSGGAPASSAPGLSKEARLALLICVAYGLTSMTTSFAFKALLSSWDFDAKFTLLGLQMSLTLSVCAFLQARPALAATPGLEVPPRVDWELARRGLLSGVLFVVNIAVGLVGLRMVNVPMFLAIRRTGTFFALAAEYLVLARVASPSTGYAVALIVAGAVLAGWDSLGRDGAGYAWTVANNALTAAAVAYSKKFSDAAGLRGFGLPLYNALVALPLCAALALASGEAGFVAAYPHLLRPGFLLALATASLLGVWTNYIHFLCGVHNGPLATSITGNVKDVLATVLGAVLPFGGTPFEPTLFAVTGLVASLAGAVLFSLAKLAESRGPGGGGGGGAGAGAGAAGGGAAAGGGGSGGGGGGGGGGAAPLGALGGSAAGAGALAHAPGARGDADVETGPLLGAGGGGGGGGGGGAGDDSDAASRRRVA